MKHLLIDFSLIAHASLFTAKEQLNHGGYDLLKHILYRSILASISQFKPDRVWVCYDGGASWRKEFSSSYKANRKEAREKQSVETGGEIDWVSRRCACGDAPCRMDPVYCYGSSPRSCAVLKRTQVYSPCRKDGFGGGGVVLAYAVLLRLLNLT